MTSPQTIQKDLYKEGIIKISVYCSQMTLEGINRNHAAKKIMLSRYKISVQSGEIKRIEDLPREEKINLRDSCKDFSDVVGMCRVKHLINCLK